MPRYNYYGLSVRAKRMADARDDLRQACKARGLGWLIDGSDAKVLRRREVVFEGSVEDALEWVLAL